jgi:predicted DNA-binding transcriptional regulator AlpA
MNSETPAGEVIRGFEPRLEELKIVEDATASIGHGFDAGRWHLLNVKEVAAVLGCSVASVWRRVADGTIPQPIKLGGTTRWLQPEIQTVIERAVNIREATR